MNAWDAWDELTELNWVLEEFADTVPSEFFGVDAMRQSLERRRTSLLDEVLTHQEAVAEHLDIVLTGEASTSRGVRVPVLVELLHDVQEALAGIGTAVARGPRRVRVSAAMRELVALRVSLALPGSLAVRLVPADATLVQTEVDLFGEHVSVLEESVGRLVSFFGDASGSETSVLDAVSAIGPRGADLFGGSPRRWPIPVLKRACDGDHLDFGVKLRSTWQRHIGSKHSFHRSQSLNTNSPRRTTAGGQPSSPTLRICVA